MTDVATIALLATTVINFGFAGLLLVSLRRRPEYYWFSTMLLGLAFWTFGVLMFTSIADTVPSATLWVHEYYFAAATIGLTLLEFSLWFPRRIELPVVTRVGIWCGYAVMCALAIFSDGLVGDVIVGPSRTVTLQSVQYSIYAALFIVFCLWALVNMFQGEYYARTKHRKHLMIQMRLVLAGAVVALAGGFYFNLILPMFNNYTHVWIGPLGTLAFTFTVLYAVIRQGLFDVRQALIRSSGYVVLFGGVAVLYTVIVFGMAKLFYHEFFQSFAGLASVQLVLTLVIVLTVVPLRRKYDEIAARVFYPEAYDNEFVVQTLRDISQKEINSKPLVIKSLRALAIALDPHYVTAYIIELDGHVSMFNGGEHNPTERQEMIQRSIVERHMNELPESGHVYDIDHLRRGTAYQLLTSAQTGGFIRLEAQGQDIGMVFFGRKHRGTYHDKDLRLFESIQSELALAVQNSLRFREIERFTETLEKRVQTATRELRTSNAKLTHLDEAKDEFISMASHQLRTPLTSVKGYIDMVLEGDAGKINDQQHKLLSEAFESSERMVHLINDFLNVSRLQTGKFMIEKRSIDLAHVVEQEVDSLKTTAASHNLRLTYRKPTRFPILSIDENKIRQVMMNFIDNAIYYSRPSTTIVVKLSINDGDAVFEVTDTGIGVPKEAQSHLFTKFFRAGNARKQRPDGTGVGLFLAKKVVTAHHGQVLFRSVEGKGSTFGFRLPLARLRVDNANNTNK